jgi:hypothetical protein
MHVEKHYEVTRVGLIVNNPPSGYRSPGLHPSFLDNPTPARVPFSFRDGSIGTLSMLSIADAVGFSPWPGVQDPQAAAAGGVAGAGHHGGVGAVSAVHHQASGARGGTFPACHGRVGGWSAVWWPGGSGS